jgi:hypothetical protein
MIAPPPSLTLPGPDEIVCAVSDPPEPNPENRRGSSRVARGWFWACAAGVVGCLGARLLHYVPFALPWPLEALLSRYLHFQIWALLFSWLALPLTAAVILFVVGLALFRRRRTFLHQDGRWGTRPWLQAVLWTLLLLYNPALDMDPRVSLLCWTSLPALVPPLWRWLDGGSRWRGWIIGAALWVAFFASWLMVTPETLERKIMAVWAGVVIPLAAVGNRRLWAPDRLWLALMLSAVTQFALSEGARENPHGGIQIGTKDYAYTFCEIPARHKLFAAVPCDGVRHGCTEGYVAEHDTRDLSRQVEHHFFSPSFTGRLVHVLCLDDTVQVGMARSVVDGTKYSENVMEFQVDDPRQFRKSLFGPVGAPRMAYDRRHEAIYYTSEWSNRIFRYDRVTGSFDETTILKAIHGEQARPGFGSYIVENDSLHEGRDTVFFAQWLSGSRIFEIDRSTLKLVETYDAHHGGTLAYVVDDELNRVWATSVWGVDVLEVGTGKLLWRTRLGLGPRLPAIDRKHDIVYIPNTGGRLWALDRRRLKVLGSLLVGGGSRNPYVSSDGSRLFGSAQHGYFYWDTAELAKRFR